MTLAAARAIAPALQVHAADPAATAATLRRLTAWCVRYTPWCAPDPQGNGIWLDITGCAHLMGGEAGLADDLRARLRQMGKRAGYTVRLAVADTPGAASAVARFLADEAPVIVPEGRAMERLESAPAAGLRLDPGLLADLDRLGLRTIGDIAGLPRISLQRRFGAVIALRLDQLTGDAGEPVSPLMPVPDLRSRIAFPEPIGTRDSIDAALGQLLDDLEARLEARSLGVRRLDLTAFRADGTAQTIGVGTSRPVRDAAALERLFRDKLDGLDPGFGIDLMMLGVRAAGPLSLKQPLMLRQAQHEGSDVSGLTLSPTKGAARDEAIFPLVDRLANKLGPRNVNAFVPVASHMPERACNETPLLNGDDDVRRAGPLQPFPRRAIRPLRLLPNPVAIDVMAPVPDHPPLLFRWRRRAHKVAHADGPERIGPEWWLEAAAGTDPAARETRDYYALEDEDGARFWVYREGLYRPDRPPKWFLHGFFS